MVVHDIENIEYNVVPRSQSLLLGGGYRYEYRENSIAVNVLEYER